MKSKSCNKEMEKKKFQTPQCRKNERMEQKLSVQHLLPLLIKVNDPLDAANAVFFFSHSNDCNF